MAASLTSIRLQVNPTALEPFRLTIPSSKSQDAARSDVLHCGKSIRAYGVDVFGITELHEQILCDVINITAFPERTRTFFSLKAVSKSWKSVMSGSLTLKRLAVMTHAPTIEGILKNLPFEDILGAQRVCKSWKAVVQESITVKQKIFLAPTPRDRTKTTTLKLHPLYGKKMERLAALPRDCGMAKSFNSRNAGWRRMFCTQPVSNQGRIYCPQLHGEDFYVWNADGLTHGYVYKQFEAEGKPWRDENDDPLHWYISFTL